MLCEIQRHFSSLQSSRDSYVGEFIATLKKQIDFLKDEVFFWKRRSQRKKSTNKFSFLELS